MPPGGTSKRNGPKHAGAKGFADQVMKRTALVELDVVAPLEQPTAFAGAVRQLAHGYGHSDQEKRLHGPAPVTYP